MQEVIVGGLLAVVGGALGCIINAHYQKRDLEAKEKRERKLHFTENRNRTYYEVIACITQFLQFLHPSVGEDFKGKYSAGVSFVDHIAALSRIQAGTQLYGSHEAGVKIMEFFAYYNSIPWRDGQKEITNSTYSELNRIANELFVILRQELQNDNSVIGK